MVRFFFFYLELNRDRITCWFEFNENIIFEVFVSIEYDSEISWSEDDLFDFY